jgi:hypothetical protein
MSTTAHTPGPWIIETRLHVHAIKDALGQDLTYQDTEPQPDAGSVTSRGRSANETLANARLIAAAPDLLAALETCVSELNQLAFLASDKLANAAIEKGIAAITKAQKDKP